MHIFCCMLIKKWKSKCSRSGTRYLRPLKNYTFPRWIVLTPQQWVVPTTNRSRRVVSRQIGLAEKSRTGCEGGLRDGFLGWSNVTQCYYCQRLATAAMFFLWAQVKVAVIHTSTIKILFDDCATAIDQNVGMMFVLSDTDTLVLTVWAHSIGSLSLIIRNSKHSNTPLPINYINFPHSSQSFLINYVFRLSRNSNSNQHCCNHTTRCWHKSLQTTKFADLQKPCLQAYASFNRNLFMGNWQLSMNARSQWHCYVTVALPDVEKYFLLQKSAVFSKVNISKSIGKYFFKMVAFCRDKKFFILHQKHENFWFPSHPLPFKQKKKLDIFIAIKHQGSLDPCIRRIRQ